MDDLRAWVGYRKRLWKMTRANLRAEADRVGVPNDSTLPRTTLIQRILEAQGIDDSVFDQLEE